MEINFIQTKTLLETVFKNKNKMVEARLRFNDVAATHFIYFNGKKMFDEGIDGEKKVVSKDDFLNNYQNNYWLIDNIV